MHHLCRPTSATSRACPQTSATTIDGGPLSSPTESCPCQHEARSCGVMQGPPPIMGRMNPVHRCDTRTTSQKVPYKAPSRGLQVPHVGLPLSLGLNSGPPLWKAAHKKRRGDWQESTLAGLRGMGEGWVRSKSLWRIVNHRHHRCP